MDWEIHDKERISAKDTKDKPPHYGFHPPYAAVCYFHRQAGRPDNWNPGDLYPQNEQVPMHYFSYGFL